jgi:hypothetical protein
VSGLRHARARARSRGRGQALVEFSLALIPFLLLLMAIFDFGRAIYMYNGLSQAAREVARAAIVHQGAGGYSDDVQPTIDTQKALIPGLAFEDPVCVNSADADDSTAIAGRSCQPDEFMVVTAKATYTPISLLGFLGTIELEAKSRGQLLSQNR